MSDHLTLIFFEKKKKKRKRRTHTVNYTMYIKLLMGQIKYSTKIVLALHCTLYITNSWYYENFFMWFYFVILISLIILGLFSYSISLLISWLKFLEIIIYLWYSKKFVKKFPMFSQNYALPINFTSKWKSLYYKD